ncbi:MAG: hypothetical protein Q7J06_04900, partial [Bacteroidales bacterium]|nr:hypothetical protein [Bacteroidales bacterium]
ELPDTRPTEWFSGAERLANQSFDRQIILHNQTLRVHYAAKICPSTQLKGAKKLKGDELKGDRFIFILENRGLLC